jgi:hypothetical protein
VVTTITYKFLVTLVLCARGHNRIEAHRPCGGYPSASLGADGNYWTSSNMEPVVTFRLKTGDCGGSITFWAFVLRCQGENAAFDRGDVHSAAMTYAFALTFITASLHAETGVKGRVFDPQRKAVAKANVILQVGSFAATRTTSDQQGQFHLTARHPGSYRLTVEAKGFQSSVEDITIPPEGIEGLTITLPGIAGQHDSIVINGKAVEPSVDMRNAEVFNRTLFTRDDQVMQQLNAGIDAGQHEGGGKSLEIRRFGFNLDHGGVNGGLKVLVDDVQQNQGTQGHGQGYLGALKALSPELIQDVTIINGPFSAEYGDFSGLGVVHIRQRESLPDQLTMRLQGGNFNNGRAFFAYSPDVEHVEAYVAYEGSYTDGPFESPSRYRRDNLNANYTTSLSGNEKLGFRFLFGRNNFYSSGQIPLDLVSQGVLGRFGFIDPTDGGRVKLGTASLYYSKLRANGDTFKADAFMSRPFLICIPTSRSTSTIR